MKKVITIAALLFSLSATAQKTQCKGITTAGKQCKRMVEKAEYCYQHARSHDNSTEAPAAAAANVQCSATTQRGTRCSRNAEKGKATCFQHSKN